MVWALVLVTVLLLSPTCVYAADDVSTEKPTQVVVDTESLEQMILDLKLENQRQLDSIQTLVSTMNVSLSNIEQYLEPKPEEKKSPGEKDTEDYLISIDEKLSDISSKMAVPEEQEQKSVTRAASFNFVAYQNVSPTNQYACYASGIIPRMRWSEHYVFLQDTSSSYVMVYGDSLEYSGNNTFTGTSCRYVRWYYSNQTVGYLTESGTADVSVSTSGHVVLSDLATYPMLEGTEQHCIRVEVAFYACVALVIRTLHHVWRFTLRNGNGTMAD